MALSSSNVQQMTAKMVEAQGQQLHLNNDLTNEEGLLEDTNSQITKYSEDTTNLFDDAMDKQSQIDALNKDIEDTNNKRNVDVAAISDKAVQDVKDAEKDKQTKIHLQKFVDESGMCGMGMGMGNTYSECGAIDLTAEELVALKDELLDLGDSQETFDSNFEQVTCALNEKLSESGSKCATGQDKDGSTYLEIKRRDGSSVKIYDANGNGALDNKDYDFCQAIQQAEEIINKMNEKISAINTKAQADVEAVNKIADEHIAENQDKIAALEKTRDGLVAEARYNNEAILPQLETEADKHSANIQNTRGELNEVGDNIDKLSGQIDKAKAENEIKENQNTAEPETAEAPDKEVPEKEPKVV